MKKIILILVCVTAYTLCYSQNIFTDDFSSFNLAKIDGQNGWSSASPSLGSGSGACASVGCLPVNVVSKSMNFPNFISSTQAINPVDGVLATGDGPGKSLGGAINSGSIYVALLANFTQPAGGTSPNGNKQVIRFMDNSFTTASRIYIKQFATGAFQIGVDKNGSAINYSSSTFSYGVDHLIILKYKFNTSSANDDVAALFVDPDLTQTEPTPTVSITGTADATSITRVVFPWNSTTLIPSGFIGGVSVAKDWSVASLPIAGISNVSLSKIQNSKAVLKFTLDNGSDFQSFLVQQSNTQTNFETIAIIDNNGNKTYSQTINLSKGMNYIKLVAVEKNGARKSSNILSLKMDDGFVKDITLAPNPTQNKLNIKLSSNQSKKITMQIIDVLGKTILQTNQIINSGETIVNTDVSALQPGSYFVKMITSNGEVETAKFIKQ
jgi:hypothetical protein